MKFVITSLVFAAVAAAQGITLSTPTGATGAIQCAVYQINWTGGQGPFDVRLLDAAQNLVEDISPTAQSSPVQWTVNQPAGQPFILTVHDATGQTGISGMFTIQTSSNTACLSASASTGGASTPAAPGSTGSAGGSSAPAASTTGGASTPASSGASSSGSSSKAASSGSPSGTTTAGSSNNSSAAMHNTVGVSLVGALFAAAAALF
jgi:hypothetical protein